MPWTKRPGHFQYLIDSQSLPPQPFGRLGANLRERPAASLRDHGVTLAAARVNRALSYFNLPDVLLDLLWGEFRDEDVQHAVLHVGGNLLDVGILRQGEFLMELLV